MLILKEMIDQTFILPMCDAFLELIFCWITSYNLYLTIWTLFDKNFSWFEELAPKQVRVNSVKWVYSFN